MKPVTRAVVLCVIATLAVTPVVAQDLVVPVTDTLWATIWSQVLIAVMPIVAGLIGYGLIEVRKLLRRLLGARADLAVNQSYEIMLRAGAGMLRAKVAQAGGTAAVERFDVLVEETIEYLRTSYREEIDAIEPDNRVLAQDILAQFGSLPIVPEAR